MLLVSLVCWCIVLCSVGWVFLENVFFFWWLLCCSGFCSLVVGCCKWVRYCCWVWLVVVGFWCLCWIVCLDWVKCLLVLVVWLRCRRFEVFVLESGCGVRVGVIGEWLGVFFCGWVVCFVFLLILVVWSVRLVCVFGWWCGLCGCWCLWLGCLCCWLGWWG